VSPHGGPSARPAHRPTGDRASRRRVAVSVLRICAFNAVLFVLYAQAPLGRHVDAVIAARVAVELLLLAAVVVAQLMAVARSSNPGLRALEAISVSVSLLILSFASAYYVTGQADPASFSERLSRTDAVYFTVSVFATVGFGDISAVTRAARIAVTVQMVADLVLIGVVARVFLGVVRQRREALASHKGQDPSTQ
jgi:voltage-gated potassium channel